LKKGSWQESSIEFEVPLWKVSWSNGGNLLAISGGEDQVVVMSEDGQTG